MEYWHLSQETRIESAKEFLAVCNALIKGQLVAIPTETVYGLAADATNGQACARIYEAKGRPSFNPLISHVDSLDAARTQGEFNDKALALAEAFWPGPLTLVLPKTKTCTVSELATAGLASVALRVPQSSIMRALSRQIGKPLAAPSANLSGKISGTTAEDVIADLERHLSWVIDGGATSVGIESTIISLIGERPTLLRPGGIARTHIEEILGEPLATAGSDDSAPQAPGMLSSHYAPDNPIRLDATALLDEDVLITFGAATIENSERAKRVINLSPAGDLTEAAANLFSALRKADRESKGKIAISPIPTTGLGEAINDRLKRAAAPK
ncbi:L-threonylcarbamoyladenylate synthase [Flexibacterium corallicola]|uniref:L-threonylcarbamoyladenylate synthase n=1 Tax=Flexibacterium corallicola TaxID=3037259 RepID=UPI00286F3105|nr:L-threonylcarbamoyladenylate synthase [Pseudovibrio sp. M1P-2-3]